MLRFLFILAVPIVPLAFVVFKAWEVPDSPEIGGYVAPGFEGLEEAYKELFRQKLEKGSSFAAYHDGRLVAHLFAGCKNFFCTEQWRADTTVLIHSCTKFLGSLALAIMADRGRLNYSERVAAYWPEFAANGKAGITVEQLLSHRAGLIGVEPGLTLEELKEGGAVVGQRLAEQKPAWEPGTQAQYHALTIGMYMDHLFRHVHPAGVGVAEFLEKEVMIPLGLDIRVGLHDEDQRSRLAPSYLFSHLRLLVKAIMNPEESGTYRCYKAFFYFPNATYRSIMSPVAGTWFGHDFFRDAYISLPLLSGNGVASVESLARLMSLVTKSGGGSEGGDFPKQLLRSADIVRAMQEPLANMSWMSDLELLYSRGHTLMRSPEGTLMFGSPGMGGQMAFADTEMRLGWAYVSNHMSPYSTGDDPRHLLLQKALYSAVKKLKK